LSAPSCSVLARHAFQRALQVVGDGHKIAQHGRGGIAHRLLALALAAAALVLRFGQGPQQLIAKLGDLGREPCGPRRLVLFRFGRFRLSDLLGCDFLARFGAFDGVLGLVLLLILFGVRHQLVSSGPWVSG
jgi:hypothetical protein